MAVYKLKDICLKIGSGATPRGGKEAYCDEGISLIRSQNVLDFVFSHDGLAHINEQQADKLSNVEVKPQDILLNITGDSVARACAVDSRVLPARVNQHVAIVRPDEEKVMSSYILFFLQMIKPYLLQIAAGGATRNALTKSMIENLELEVPDILSQKKIVAVLDDIQEKIRENKEINKNLEQQAQAIFLKMFPDIFSVSASSSFQNLIEFSNGKKRPETIGDIPVYGGNGVLAYTNQSNAENCVIIGRVGAYCGNTFLCPEKCWTSDNAIQAKSKNEDSPLFIYYLLRNASLPLRHIGTGQPLMTQAILNAIPVNEPSTQEIRSFINVCTPLHEAIFANEKQNISLALLRDTLLPKLMSGELDVSDIDL